MTFLKYIQILFLVFFPVCLVGMKDGSRIVQDRYNRDVRLEWRIITDHKKLLEIERDLIPVMVAAFSHHLSHVEVKDEKVEVETKWLQQQNAQEMSKCTQGQQAEHEVFVVVTVKDIGSSNVLGYAVFYLGPKIAQDCVAQDCVVKGCAMLDPLAVIPMAQGRGLSRILVFSIFELVPSVRQIDLFVQRENVRAQAVFRRFGFVVDSEIKAGLILKYVKKI